MDGEGLAQQATCRDKGQKRKPLVRPRIGGVRAGRQQAERRGAAEQDQIARQRDDPAGEQSVGPDRVAGEPDFIHLGIFHGDDHRDFRHIGAVPVIGGADAAAVDEVHRIVRKDFPNRIRLRLAGEVGNVRADVSVGRVVEQALVPALDHHRLENGDGADGQQDEQEGGTDRQQAFSQARPWVYAPISRRA